MRISVEEAALFMHARDATLYQSDLHGVMRDVLRNASCALSKLAVACQFADDVLSIDIEDDDIDEVVNWLEDDIDVFGEEASEHAHIVLGIIASYKRRPTTH